MSETILLTFVGTGNYQDCRYQIGSQCTETHTFFSVALASQLKPAKVISLQTPDAHKKHGEALDRAFRFLGIEHLPVDIPEGKTESELWKMFEALTTHIPRACTLHLDITHGFRSLPVLGFIALSYLRVTREVTIGGIHYGAWEARDNDLAPTFDLTPFLVLLDWTAAADQFLSTGSAERLANLLSEAQQRLWKNPGELTKSDLPRALKNLASSLSEASDNQILLRTGQLASGTAHLKIQMERAAKEAAGHAAPFLDLLAPVREELTSFADTRLRTLRDLIAWLARRGQIAASLTLASEWLTSYAMVVTGNQEHHAAYAKRQSYSLAISLLERPERPLNEDVVADSAREHLATLRQRLTPDQLRTLSGLASTIRSVRNDLNHAGFNDAPATAKALKSSALKISTELVNLPLPDEA